jgi:hypothetical protein
MAIKLRTYNCEEKAYRAAMKRARIDSSVSLSEIIAGFVTVYGEYGVSGTEINNYLSSVPRKKKKTK